MWKGEERGHHFDCCCAGHGCSFSSVNWSDERFYERGWVQRRGGCWLLVLNGMWGGRQARRKRRQQPIHEYPQCCSPASCIHFPNKEPQWCPLLSWLAEAAPGDAQSHVGGREDGVCLSVCEGLARSWLWHHTARLHVPSPRPASGHTKGMMSCLANNKSVWVRWALLSHTATPALSSLALIASLILFTEGGEWIITNQPWGNTR